MESMSEVLNVEKIFNQNVFTLGKMKERLPRKVFNEVKNVMDHGGELSLAAADVVAKAMKDWAVENGATHYTHWFQPLTGVTAEKHDSFVTNPDEEGKMIYNLGYYLTGILKRRCNRCCALYPDCFLFLYR